jgi:cardiolipin synthase
VRQVGRCVTQLIRGRRRLSAALLAAFLLTACASQPAPPSSIEIRATAEPRIVGADGRLSRRQSETVLAALDSRVEPAETLKRHIAEEQSIVGSPLVAGNKAVLLEDGPATYKAMFAAISAARDHINLQTYIFEDDQIGRQFADLMLEKQAQGVQVNVIYDSVGSIRTPRAFFDRLRAAGISVLEFNPVNPFWLRSEWLVNHRDHRKLLVVDGRKAFVGGINISSVYSSGSAGAAFSRGGDRGDEKLKKNGWRDTHVEIEGPVVNEFQKLFMDTWLRQKAPALAQRQYFPDPRPAGDELVRAIGSTAYDPYSLIYVTLLSAIEHAERRVHITIAYFIPDQQSLDILKHAARRGVDVRLILPGVTDFWAVFYAGRAYYRELLESGVRIYERKGALLHSKTVVVDDVWSCIGSTNWDPRSFLHNDEINAVILGQDLAGQLEAMFQRDLQDSEEITLEAWKRRAASERVKEWVSGLFEYWL